MWLGTTFSLSAIFLYVTEHPRIGDVQRVGIYVFREVILVIKLHS